jgi:hypothetical protein
MGHNLRGTAGSRVITDFSADSVDEANALTARADGELGVPRDKVGCRC